MKEKEITALFAKHGYAPCPDCNGLLTKDRGLCSDCQSARMQKHFLDIKEGAEVMSLLDIMRINQCT